MIMSISGFGGWIASGAARAFQAWMASSSVLNHAKSHGQRLSVQSMVQDSLFHPPGRGLAGDPQNGHDSIFVLTA